LYRENSFAKKHLKMKTQIRNLLIAVIFFLLPNMNFAQTPNLGTAADFVLFTTVGAVTNTGTSHLTGNVGTNSASSTGFGNVNGVMHDGDGASALCAADLLTAYGTLDAAIPIFFPAPLLGNGQILVPGVYSIPAPATLNLDLTFDAQGDPSAVFIVQIEGTFSTAAGSSIKLINGALACNVFWKVEGLVDMTAGTIMRGTIIANNAAINMNSGTILEGRALSTNGAITLNGTLAYTPVGCGSPALTGPMAPTLSATECFTIFSSDGAVTNTGITYVTGDVGTNNGLTTGYNPLFVTGAIHPIPDGSTVAAAAELLTIYNYLNTLPYDIELLYPAQFGNSLVLTPHTYLMNGAVTFTDTVYLDAMGDPDAVFIIKVYGAFSTSTYSKVKLINGTVVENVYWMINGAVTLNNYSEFEGTIVCANGAMDLLTGALIHGRAMTTVGVLTTDAITAIMPLGCPSVSEPIVITEPVDQTACLGGSVSFTVTATGTALTYQWRKGSVDLIDGGNISGANTATLTINPVALSDAAIDYNVIVSGTYMPSDTSVNVALIIESGPVITTQPTDQTACVGSSASFSVTATGGSLTYQWRRGIIDLVDGLSISGATTDVLTIDPVSALDFALDYNVVITGACAPDAISINVSLSGGTGPVITTEPVDQIACVGDIVSFSVIATGTGLTYQWRKGTVDLIDGGSISGAMTDILTINPVSLLDVATDYNVVITGDCPPNDTSINVSLSVDTGPVITTQPVDQSVCIGDSAIFTVVATGPGLTYQWRKGLTNLINGASVFGVTTDTLVIYPVSALDVATDYNVVITGSCLPDAVSINVSLEVSAETVITTAPVNQIICEGDSVSFFVVATGSNLTYQWRKGIVNLVDGGNISGATSDTLTINPATLADMATNYNVVISGGCSTVNTLDTDLNSAGGFGILAGTAITSTGFSEIHDMDVGLSPGVRSSITGFPPAIVVNGAIYASDDVAPPGVAAMLIQAKQDLTDAYLFAEGATAPAPVTVAGDQGGLTLAPGIYKSTSTLLIQSGDLTLDAQGDSNAVWIFQIASDFTSIGGAGGSVILTGGALAKNVYWQVGSSATIGNGTAFKGTIMALTSITMNTGSSIDGRLLARNGAVVLSGTNIINQPSDSAVNNISITTVNVSLTVNTATVITTEPVNQIACTGDPVSFSVIATGTGLAYQWYNGITALIDGINISGANTSVLTIDPVSLTDASLNYHVIVSGDCLPEDTSIYVSLTVNTGTIITTEPVDQTVCEGNSASFSVIASGTGLTYQWYIGTTAVIDGINISGANTSVLTIDPVNLTDAAMNYNVIVSGDCLSEDTSINVSLIVNSGTIITTEPVDQTVCEGNSVSFSVIASGTGLTYQWYNGIVALIDGVNISGVTTSVLTIDPVTISDTSSFYNVIVSGDCLPEDTSIFVSLMIDTATVITTEPVDLTACEGSSVIFSVNASGTGLTYQWYNGTTALVDGINISGSATQMLQINPVALANASTNYNVIVTGDCFPGDSSVYVSLIVNPLPVAIATSNSPVCTGSSIILTAETVTGATYQWTNTTGYLSSDQNPEITAASESDQGIYTLIVSLDGCVSSPSSTNVVVDNCIGEEFFIPEGFSPNGDGINDLFVIRGIDRFPNNTFTIFNRWGNEVYEASPYTNTWDGSCLSDISIGNGNLPVGTYFYVLDLGDGSDVYKGTIYLNR